MFKPQGSKREEKVAAYSPEITVHSLNNSYYCLHYFIRNKLLTNLAGHQQHIRNEPRRHSQLFGFQTRLKASVQLLR